MLFYMWLVLLLWKFTISIFCIIYMNKILKNLRLLHEFIKVYYWYFILLEIDCGLSAAHFGGFVT